jgi:hypothetical protein
VTDEPSRVAFGCHLRAAVTIRMEMCLGVDAEQRSLEDGAEPLSARSARSALT